jgi:hypothetical protein
MTPWVKRPAEERALLNPGFCACLLWQAAAAYEGASKEPLPFDLAFLVLPMVLHRATRDSLPKVVKSSLAVWLNDNPLAPSRLADRARTISPFTKEAMLFGGVHGLLRFKGTSISANRDMNKGIAADLKDSTNEVKICAKRAEFLGKWFAASGNPGTIMAIMGVRP